MFSGCSKLAEFESDLTKLVDGGGMFGSCPFKTFAGDMPSLTTATNMFIRCEKLESFSGDLHNLKTALNMFMWCYELKHFYSGPSGLASLTSGGSMFADSKLDLESVQHIADTINPGVSSGSIKISVDKGLVTQEQQDVLDAQFRAKNWTVTWARK